MWVGWEGKLLTKDWGNFSQNVSIKVVVLYDIHSWIPSVLGNKTYIHIIHTGASCVVDEKALLVSIAVLFQRELHIFALHVCSFSSAFLHPDLNYITSIVRPPSYHNPQRPPARGRLSSFISQVVLPPWPPPPPQDTPYVSADFVKTSQIALAMPLHIERPCSTGSY